MATQISDEREENDSFDSTPEEWEFWESYLVLWPIGIAIVMIPVFGGLINSYLLP